jgi:hypothetical protein
MRPPGAGPEVRSVARNDKAQAIIFRKADGVIAALFGNPLPDGVLRIKVKAGSAFVNDSAIGVEIEVAGLNLLEIIDQQLHAMRIDAAEIRGNQRFGHKPGLMRRSAVRQQDTLAKVGELFGGYDDLRHELPA